MNYRNDQRAHVDAYIEHTWTAAMIKPAPLVTTIRTTEDAKLWLDQNGHGDIVEGDHVRVWAGCTRCGGEGGSRAWLTYTCYQCGGQDTRNLYHHIPVKAYAQKLKRKANAEARKVAKAKAQAEAQSAAFDAQLAASPELAAALQGDHPILRDLRERRTKLSEKQVELALKIVRQLAEREAEAKVAAPEGRVEVEGELVSVKWRDSDYGGAWKMTVKVATPEGSWLCWGTMPVSVEDQAREQGLGVEALRGRRVRFTATLSRSDEAHFAFFKRPAKAELAS